MHKVIKFNQKAWLMLYIKKNTELRKKKQKNDFEKDFFNLMNNSVFEKTMVKVKKCRDSKLVTTEKRRTYLSEPNYHSTKFISENLLTITLRKIFMNKPVRLGLSILELSKIVMHEFLYDYVKLKYG